METPGSLGSEVPVKLSGQDTLLLGKVLRMTRLPRSVRGRKSNVVNLRNVVRGWVVLIRMGSAPATRRPGTTMCSVARVSNALRSASRTRTPRRSLILRDPRRFRQVHRPDRPPRRLFSAQRGAYTVHARDDRSPAAFRLGAAFGFGSTSFSTYQLHGLPPLTHRTVQRKAYPEGPRPRRRVPLGILEWTRVVHLPHQEALRLL